MKTRLRRLTRPLYVLVASVLFVLGVLPFLGQAALAAPLQVTSRSIELSDSTPSATNVSYNVTFTPQTSITHPDVLVDFCSNSPLIGDSCTATAGTNVPNFTGTSAGANWTLTTIGTNRGVKLTTATQSFTSGTPVTITITGVANPSATGTFYGRILTYLTSAAGTNTSDSPGTYQDYGGIALSTATAVSITAKVMESLTFCASAADISGDPDCTNATTPALNLGQTIGSNVILDGANVYPASAYTKLATNAQHGAVVRMKDTNAAATCGGLSSDGGTTCGVPAVGTSAAIITKGDTTGNAAFGMCIAKGANTTLVATYDDTANNCPTTYNASSLYGFDDTNVRSTYGAQLYSTAGAVLNENNRCTFVATAALTTPAGIYTGTYALIATGTF